MADDWAQYLVARDRLRRHGLADELMAQLAAMGPTEALPLMRQLLAVDREVIAKVNEVERSVRQATRAEA